jgi:hypothetical protein
MMVQMNSKTLMFEICKPTLFLSLPPRSNQVSPRGSTSRVSAVHCAWAAVFSRFVGRIGS